MEHEIELALGRRLRRRRRLLGMTQQDLASLCGLRFQQIQKYESGVNRISAARLYTLARALGVSPSYFYEGFDPQSRAPGELNAEPGTFAAL